MTTRLLMALLSIVLVATGKPAQNDVPEELKRLRGIWRIVEEIDNGKHMSATEASKNRLTFDGEGRWKVEIDGRVVGEGTAKIDPTRKPKTIDYTFTKGDGAGARFLAIYELEGDSFRHCGVLTGLRPLEFSSKPGSEQILTTFRRDRRE